MARLAGLSLGRLLSGLALWLTLIASASAAPWPHVEAELGDRLKGGELEQRREAAAELASLPEGAQRRLLPVALADVDSEVRVLAARLALELGLIPGPSVTRWLQESSAPLRALAARWLGRHPRPKEVTRALGRALADADLGVRLAAVGSLTEIGGAEAARLLAEQLNARRLRLQLAVVRALGVIGDPASVGALVNQARDARDSVRRAVILALSQFTEPRAVEALRSAIKDEEPSVRSAAVGGLGGDEDSRAQLAELLHKDGNLAVRIAVAEALAAASQPEAGALLIEVIPTAPAELRERIRALLRRYGSHHLELLRRCTAGPGPRGVIAICAEGLGHHGAPSDVQRIAEVLERGVLSFELGMEAVGRLGRRRDLPLVLRWLQSNDASVRGTALQAAQAILSRHGGDGRVLEPASAALLQAREPHERNELVRLIGLSQSPRALSALEPMQGSTDPSLRWTVAEALGRLGPAAGPALLTALQDEHGRVRWTAALGLRRSGADSVLAPLMQMLRTATGRRTRELLIALAGPVSRSEDGAVEAELSRRFFLAATSERDLWLEVIAASAQGAARLERLLPTRGPRARAKIAELWAARAAQERQLLALLKDPQAPVRANAAWALGRSGSGALPELAQLFEDPSPLVAPNAVAAQAARLRRASGQTLPAQSLRRFCAATAAPHAYSRANALTALRLMSARCPLKSLLELLRSDPSESARAAAARWLSAQLRSDQLPTEERLSVEQALRRCRLDEPSGKVAQHCLSVSERAFFLAPEVVQKGDDAKDSEGHVLRVGVTASGSQELEANTAFAVQSAEGWIRVGLTDRSGSFQHLGTARGLHLLPAVSDAR